MGSGLRSRIQGDLVAARKARNRLETRVLSTALADIRNREIDGGATLDDDGIVAVLTGSVKKRRDAARQMRDAGRIELAEGEEREAEILSAYLPAALDEAEVRRLVVAEVEAGADAIGPLMGRLMPKIRGRFDGKEANRVARTVLEELDAARDGRDTGRS